MKGIARYLSVALVVAALSAVVGCAGGGAPSSGAEGQDASASAAASGQESGALGDSSAVSVPAAALDAANLADGEYTLAVTLEGGTGRATVESPAKLIVSDGVLTAVIVWSSPNYDQMVVDGEQYFPVPRAGNSTFEIPVSQLDADLPVKAETTAMSEPHMIDYTLRFDSSTLEQA